MAKPGPKKINFQYKVRDGFRFGAARQYGPGDIVTLTREEAVGFLDKLVEATEEDLARKPREIVVEAVPETQAALAQYLSPETVDVLELAGYVDLAQILNLSWKEITAIHGVGPVRAAEIRNLQKLMKNREEEE